MDKQAENVRLFYERKFKEYWEEKYREYQEGCDSPSDGFAFLHDYPLRDCLRHGQNFEGIPESVFEAYDFYKEYVMDADWGNVKVYEVSVEGCNTFAVRTTTDGDDGWLEVFDDRGQSIGAARTYIELIAWGSTDSIRAQVDTGEFPPELNDRQTATLWGN